MGSIKLCKSIEMLKKCYEILNLPLKELPKTCRKYCNNFISITNINRDLIFSTKQKINVVDIIDDYAIAKHPLYTKIEDLYLNGYTKQADNEIIALKKQSITQDEEKVLKLLKRNRSILISKGKYN